MLSKLSVLFARVWIFMATSGGYGMGQFLPFPGQFHIIGVQRRMADWSFEKAQTWEDLLVAHEKWLRDYNFQRHMAHEDRDDGSHSPAQVLNWQRGTHPEPELLYRTFSAIGETRVLNKAGYAKFRNFLLYGEQGLAGQETFVNIFQDTLTVILQHIVAKLSAISFTRRAARYAS